MFFRNLKSGAFIGIIIILLLFCLASPLVIPTVAIAESGSGGETPAETPSLSMAGYSIPIDSTLVEGNDGEQTQEDPSILESIIELF